MSATKGLAMRINSGVSGIVLPSILAGVIYFGIAFATGASAGAAVIGGIVIAVIAIVIGSTFRAVYYRRARRHR